MPHRITIDRIPGAPVQIHFSLALMCLPVALLASFGRDSINPGAGQGPSWALGLLGALIYCASMYLHELGHFVALRHFGIHVESISLNAFGGRTRAPGVVPSPKVDFVVSLAGPASTLALTGLGFGGAFMLRGSGAFAPSLALTLGLLNLSLLPGCLIPVWPTDMYRALRAIAWQLSGSFPAATQAACGISLAMIAVAIVAGVLTFVLPVSSEVSRLGLYTLLAGLIFLLQGRGIISTMRQSLQPIPVDRSAQQHRQAADRRAA